MKSCFSASKTLHRNGVVIWTCLSYTFTPPNSQIHDHCIWIQPIVVFSRSKNFMSSYIPTSPIFLLSQVLTGKLGGKRKYHLDFCSLVGGWHLTFSLLGTILNLYWEVEISRVAFAWVRMKLYLIFFWNVLSPAHCISWSSSHPPDEDSLLLKVLITLDFIWLITCNKEKFENLKLSTNSLLIMINNAFTLALRRLDSFYRRNNQVFYVSDVLPSGLLTHNPTIIWMQVGVGVDKRMIMSDRVWSVSNRIWLNKNKSNMDITLSDQ